ncbi:G-type lectin S-receptor-like serine/threonine-protein kinase At4g27290 isoform X2 [Lycium barbarum]|uniref:G-type lectin S-receptor-like serine/threonine-protein kinase At4g27290 isoform X2 n=1 Tax=Lycium barbarum TaxID=112863 RepID=UPI00293E5CAE|nr:G-type lectin S-receptor-like serine/threonine-protein kinase At4g27290 isoform X2 [Lycium barbarum]
MEFQVSSFVMFYLLLTFLSLNSSPIFGQENQHYASIGNKIDAKKSIIIGVTIVSSGGNFELGFFATQNTSNYYLGIWYKDISPQTVMWVANRETKLSFSEMGNAEFRIRNGNLVLLNGTRRIIWSTNVNSKNPNSVTAVLGDDGNFVLRDGINSTSRILWQSFDHLSNTFVPGSKISYNKKTKELKSITSWRSLEDPSSGPFSIEIDPIGGAFRAMWNGTEEYWSSGTWNGDTFTNLPHTKPHTTVNNTYINDDKEISFTYTLYSPLLISRFVIDVTGELKQFTWIDSSKQWNVFFLRPAQPCNVYAYCGAFGTCNPNSSSLCSCLPGFVPRLDNDWDLNIFSQGCVRKANLICGSSSAPFKDKFWLMSRVTLPKYYETIRVTSATECESTCFNNCSCTAYAYDGSECLNWSRELLNLQQLPQDDQQGRNLFIKLAASDFPSDQATKQKQSSMRVKAIIPAIVSVIILLVCCFTYIYFRRRIAQRKVQRNHLDQWQSSENAINDLTNEDENIIDVPFFSFESILAATDHFSEANMLGRGGFGPVYKGKFPGGRDIAVKRLSTQSGQGIEEFKNEVLLIARLQHRNLVRLLGYCVKGNEQIVLYEYLSNRSLDTFIFDKENRILLDWKKRFNIILGIARGLSYLHHDSRLRIIHRDLKTSNVLLDEGMNPKISDFGLARIVQGNTTQANTSKVVGTYGYMSPEYALDGLFSTKSDVFSFGVVILEIISGRRNTGFYNEGTNLLGHAWRLWTEEKAINLVDESLHESTCNIDEVIKCINIGLLCVQENSSDRPNMSNVILMLGGESMSTLPRPNQPAFVARPTASSTSTTLSSNNELTITIEKGR